MSRPHCFQASPQNPGSGTEHGELRAARKPSVPLYCSHEIRPDSWTRQHHLPVCHRRPGRRHRPLGGSTLDVVGCHAKDKHCRHVSGSAGHPGLHLAACRRTGIHGRRPARTLDDRVFRLHALPGCVPDHAGGVQAGLGQAGRARQDRKGAVPLHLGRSAARHAGATRALHRVLQQGFHCGDCCRRGVDPLDPRPWHPLSACPRSSWRLQHRSQRFSHDH